MKYFLLGFLIAAPALAETPMTGTEFDAYTRGKTFYFAEGGRPYGGEEYFDNRRVRWSFLDGKCKDGIWYEDAGHICFVYEDTPDPQCWSFFKRSHGLEARFESGGEDATVLYESRQSEKPMICHGPDVGV